MQRTIRKSRRLAKKRNKHAGRRMSVGEALGLPRTGRHTEPGRSARAGKRAQSGTTTQGRARQAQAQTKETQTRAQPNPYPYPEGNATPLTARSQRRREATPPQIARAQFPDS